MAIVTRSTGLISFLFSLSPALLYTPILKFTSPFALWLTKFFGSKGLVTDYESGLNWVREGGLDRVITTKVQAEVEDAEQNTRGRLPRRNIAFPSKKTLTDSAHDNESDAAGLSVSYDGGRLAHNIPLKAYTSTPTVLPEEGERVPNPKHPETPPHSKSRDHSPSSDDEYDFDVSENSPRITTGGGPSVAISVGSNHNDNLTGGSNIPMNTVTSVWEHGSPPLHLLFLGSSLGNFDRVGSANFLRLLPLRPGSSDTLLLGLDGRNQKARVEKAYNDPVGYTEKFILNGLNVTARALGLNGDEANLIDRFQYLGVYNEDLGE